MNDADWLEYRRRAVGHKPLARTDSRVGGDEVAPPMRGTEKDSCADLPEVISSEDYLKKAWNCFPTVFTIGSAWCA